MGADTVRVSCARVVADEYDTIERLVNPLHHAEGTRKRPNDLDILGKFVNQQVLAVTMGVTHQDLVSACFSSTFNGSDDFLGEEFPKTLVFKSARS